MHDDEPGSFAARLCASRELVERFCNTGDASSQAITCLLDGVWISLRPTKATFPRYGSGEDFTVSDE